MPGETTVPVATPSRGRPNQREAYAITTKRIAADIADCHPLTAQQVEAAVDSLVNKAVRHLRNGDPFV